MVQKTLKLAEGRSVPMEDGKEWPVDGATVEVTLYIRRRLADGDLVEYEPSAPAPAAEEAIVPQPEPASGIKAEPEIEQSGRKGRNGGK